MLWMVRAAGGDFTQAFEQKQLVAVGFGVEEDLGGIKSREKIRELYEKYHPGAPSVRASNVSSMLYKFRAVMKPGDRVISYDPPTRNYLVGEIASDYYFDPSAIDGAAHIRKVKWTGKVERDQLSLATRNTLGSLLTIFAVDGDAASEVLELAKGEATAGASKPRLPVDVANEAREEIVAVKEDEEAKAFELVKDAIVALDDHDLEKLVASILRAMGYRARVTPIGPDRGVDVIASPDGLGLEEPRIRAEVKHRPKTSMGSQEIRSFLGGLRPGDRGLYISKGGFTKEARYEAERANVPLTLIDLGDLASLVWLHYEAFDVDGRVILPLVRIYLPSN